MAEPLRPEIETFIGEMVARHGFGQAELEDIFGAVKFQPTIIDAISRPATSRPWHEFRPVFINPRRITGGVDFWNNHAATLERARAEFGVPEEIITAIIGVETTYRISSTDYLDGFSYSGHPTEGDFYFSHTIGLYYNFIRRNRLNCPKF